MYRWCNLAVALAMFGLAGCQTRPPVDAAQPSSWPSPRPLGNQIAAYRPPSQPDKDETRDTVDPSDLPPPPNPSGDLTLRRAMTLALTHSPKLRAYGWDVRRVEAKALQASRWPNPQLEAKFENFAGSGDATGFRSLETTISLAQTFPLGGAIEQRRELAGFEAQSAGWDYEAARLDVLTEVTRRYVALLAWQHRVTLAQEALQLAQQVREATRKRIDAGDAPQIEWARARVPEVMARVDLRRAQRSYDASRKQLALTWGSTTPSFDQVMGSFEVIQAPPPPDALAALINQNPQVARWATEISARLAEAHLAEAEAIPELTGRLGYRNNQGSGEHALVAGVSIPLPVFDRRKADTLAARLGAVSAQQRRRQAKLHIEALLSEAYARLVNAYDEATAIRDEALPPATEAFEVTRRAFEKGDLVFIDVLDAERTLVELRTRYIEALAQYHTAVAEIEALIGQPLNTLDPSNHTNQPEPQGVDTP